jgi:S-adenosylmethionine-dependent methyltransferase
MLETSQFQDADKYSAYLRTFSGRLRSDLAWENLQGFLPALARHRRVLDLGGGTGVMSVRLASKEFQVVLLDSSEEMLAIAQKEAEVSEVAGRISLHKSDADQLQKLFEPESFDVVVCHNMLEYVADPGAIVRSISRLLRKDGLVSLLLRNRDGEVLKTAIKSSDLELAKNSLSAETVVDSLYGKPLRVFDLADVRHMLTQANLDIIEEFGVRVFSDYMDSTNVNGESYRKVLESELVLGARPQFAAIARYLQVIARPTNASQISQR